MSYDIRFNVAQTGAETIDQITGKLVVMKTQVSAVASEMTQAAKRVSDAEAQMAAAVSAGNTQWATSLADVVAKEKVGLETLVAKHRELKAGVDEVTSSFTRMTPAVTAANAEFALMEGRLPTRALGQFATNVLGLGPILQMAFPVFGAIALGEVLVSIGGKMTALIGQFDPLVRAEDRAKETTKALTSEFKKLNDEIARMANANFEDTFGKTAGLAHQAAGLVVGSQGARNMAGGIPVEIAELNAKKARLNAAAPFADADTAAQIQTDIRETDIALQEKYHQLAAFQEQIQVTTGESSHLSTESLKSEDATRAEQIRAGIEATRRNSEFTRDSVARASDAQAKSGSDPYATVHGEIQARLDKAAQSGVGVSSEAMAAATRETIARNSEITRGLIKRAQTEGARLPEELKKLVHGENEPSDATSKQSGADMLYELRKAITQGDKTHADDRAVGIDDASSDVSRVRRQLQSAMRANSTRGGGPGGAQGAGLDYQAQLSAAQRVFDIEDKRVALYDNENEKIKDNAANKKQLAESQYQAEAQYAEQLDDLREKNLDKYRKDAESIFDALTNRQLGAGHALTQLLRKDALSEGSQIFGNVIGQHVLQPMGQAIAGAMPSSLGGILHGTVLDPANKAIESHTKDAADYLKHIDQTISGDPSASGSAPAGVSPSAGAAGSAAGILGGLSSAATSGGTGILGTIAKAIGSIGGGIGSVFSGDALSTLLGQTETKDSSGNWNATSTGDRVGAGVGLAATLAGGAFGILSGIHQGGVGGALTATGSAVGSAAVVAENITKLIAPLSSALSVIPIVGSIAAIALPLIGGLLGQGPTQRANQINQQLSSNQYIAPQALNVTQDSGGNFTDFDARGNIRTSDFSAVPTVRQGSIWEQTHGLFGPPPTYYNVPGTQTGQFGAVTPTTVVNNNINAMDVQSFAEFADKNHIAIGNAAARNLQNIHGALATEVHRTANG
jgi:hypothetical protein